MPCPCGSDNALEACCGPYLRGDAHPATAEALMRARYTAYATGEVDFVMSSQKVDGEESDREATEAWSRQSTWIGLDVVKVEGGGPLDDEGTVEFVARYSHKDQEYAHHEEATFKKTDGRWWFIDGKMKNSTFRRSTPKMKPNEPCPCGSGKKWKKCCGKR
jgi:SEC-C motif-containing protein